LNCRSIALPAVPLNQQNQTKTFLEKIMFTRRNVLKGTSSAMLAMAAHEGSPALVASAQEAQPASAPLPGDANRAERMKRWKADRFGMFIHFGVYSTIWRREWVTEDEAIPVSEYAPYAATFHPREGSPRAWVRLAKQAGMKYLVMTASTMRGFATSTPSLQTTALQNTDPAATWLANTSKPGAQRECALALTTRSWTGLSRRVLCATNEDKARY
jgi:Alpha-L-fucosidase